MKKIYIILLALVSLFITYSCSDSSYADKYTDPSTTSVVTCDRLMTGAFYEGRIYTLNAYWRIYVFDNPIPGKYAQTIGYQNNDNGSYYSPNDSYVNGFWSGFYNILVQYRLLESTYDKLSEIEKKDQKIFKDLTEVFLYDHLSRRVDFFGDMPFDKAGYLGITSDVTSSYAAYDKASDIYVKMLDRLGVLAEEIKNAEANLSPLTKSKLPKQDFINNGDLSLWVSYANALRLRIATRLASQGTLTTKARSVVADILNGNKQLPTNVDNMIVLTMVGKETDFIDKNDFFNAYIDQRIASQQMLDVLTKSVPNEVDPRLAIMYTKNAKGVYKGYSRKETLGEQQVNETKEGDQRVYSTIDTTLVMRNTNFISPIISAAEVDFCRSEAYLNSWANGDAKQAFVDGVVNSVDYYFEQYQISPYQTTYPKAVKPPKADIIAYAEKLWDNSSNKLETIITQKWLNFGYMQSAQAWHEICRTGFPKLDYLFDRNAAEYKTPPYRLKYPQKEKANNTTNYNNQITSMGGTDNPYLKLIWQKTLQTN